MCQNLRKKIDFLLNFCANIQYWVKKKYNLFVFFKHNENKLSLSSRGKIMHPLHLYENWLFCQNNILVNILEDFPGGLEYNSSNCLVRLTHGIRVNRDNLRKIKLFRGLYTVQCTGLSIAFPRGITRGGGGFYICLGGHKGVPALGATVGLNFRTS